MTLVLRIENAERLGPGTTAVFRVTENGASVGRRNTMDWVLPDPDRLISGHHFDIRFRDGIYYISDLSTNGTFIGGTRQRVTADYPLRGGERLVVGHYSIAVDVEAVPREAPRPVSGGSFAGLRRPSFSGMSDDSGLRVPAAPRGAGGKLQVPSLSVPHGDARPSERPTPIADDRGVAQHPFRLSPRDSDPVVSAAPHGAATPLSDETQVRAVSPRPEASPDAAVDRTVYAAAPVRRLGQVGSPAGDTPDPWKGPADSAHAQAPMDRSGRDDRAALIAAFCKAAGLPPETVPVQSAEALMAVLGESHRIIADELMRMLKLRGTMKVFVLGSQQTMLGATDNNPLKFMSDRTEALETLFGPAREGFLPAPEAFAEALREIRCHHEAFLEATQAALGDVFDGLSPEEIRDTAQDHGADALWNAYRERWYEKSNKGEFGILDSYLAALEKAYADAIRRRNAP